MNKLDAYWDFLIDNGIVSEDALRLVTNINGYSEDTLNDVLYCQTGNRSVEQYCDENEIELPDFVEESTNISSITNKILEGADICHIIGMRSANESLMSLNNVNAIASDIYSELYGEDMVDNPRGSSYYTLGEYTVNDGEEEIPLSLTVNVVKYKDSDDGHTYYGIYNVIDSMDVCDNIVEPDWVYTDDTSKKSLIKALEDLQNTWTDKAIKDAYSEYIKTV